MSSRSLEAWIYWTYNRMTQDIGIMAKGSGLHTETAKYVLSKGTKNKSGKYIDSQGEEYNGQEIN